ncbi:MAG: hypothetical protein M0Z27_07510 [Thermaerobacter sp.]|nr:hypothetical protein [Thermaerobacter sp.]
MPPGYVVDASALIQAARQSQARGIFPVLRRRPAARWCRVQTTDADRGPAVAAGGERPAEGAGYDGWVCLASTDRVGELPRQSRGRLQE